MRSKLIIFCTFVLVFRASQVFAHGGVDHGEPQESEVEDKAPMYTEKILPDAVNIGNAICPVSGELISEVGDGKGIQLEYVGKIYNVCCKFCAKDFKKNPRKFIRIIKKKLAEGKDPGRDYENDPDDDTEYQEGSHEKSDE